MMGFYASLSLISHSKAALTICLSVNRETPVSTNLHKMSILVYKSPDDPLMKFLVMHASQFLVDHYLRNCYLSVSQTLFDGRLVRRDAVPIYSRQTTSSRGSTAGRTTTAPLYSDAGWNLSTTKSKPSNIYKPFTPALGGRATSESVKATDGFSYGKLTVTNYVCNLCGTQYKHQCNLLTHQVRVHGREKKKNIGRRPKAANCSTPSSSFEQYPELLD